jgi:antitoxin component YwqK of YwqJK toxin-antitoxin module
VDADALGTATTCPPHTTAKRRAHTYGVPQRTGHEEWCETAAGVKHGYWRKTWQGGLLKEQGTYRNGKLDGAWTEWFDNGQESREGGYRNGNRHGVWRGWWGSRKLADERYYEDGVAVGIWTEWYPSGEVMTRGGWLDGEQHGEDIAYEVNGVVARVLVFDRGKLVKAELYENGVVVKSATGTRDEPVDLEALEGVVE